MSVEVLLPRADLLACDDRMCDGDAYRWVPMTPIHEATPAGPTKPAQPIVESVLDLIGSSTEPDRSVDALVSRADVDRALLVPSEDKCLRSYDGDAYRWMPPTTPHDAKLAGPTKPAPPIVDSVLDLIGSTPLVRLSRFAAAHGLKCELLGKLEFMNPGGSIKDRMAHEVLRLAIERGELTPGDCLIEATSGNTGIGFSLVGNALGYGMVATLPERMSLEKEVLLNLLGAQTIRTPNVPSANPKSHIGMASRLGGSCKKLRHLDQYKHEGNCLAHYNHTGREILEQCEGKLDVMVIGAGTGGTITGVGSRIKAEVPSCRIVGVDPQGSMMAEPRKVNELSLGKPYHIEGIGHDFIPDSLNRQFVDEWVKTDDQTSFRLARELIRLEGLLCGGSCGAALQGALVAARDLDASQRCVVILPDGIRNYMSKFGSDRWMIANGYMSVPRAPSNGFLQDGMTVGDVELLPIEQTFPSCVPLKQLMRFFSYRPDSNPANFAIISNQQAENTRAKAEVAGVVLAKSLMKALCTDRLEPVTRETTAEDSGVVTPLSYATVVRKSLSLYNLMFRLQDDQDFAFVVADDCDVACTTTTVTCEGLVSRQSLLASLSK